MKTQPPLQVGDLFQNQFEIRRLLGAGGYGFVYHAYNRTMAREVALKLIEIPTPDRQRRACLEAQVTHRLTHPNIVRGYGAGVWTDRWIYVELELLRGRSVGQALHEHKTLTVLEAFFIAAQAAEGVHAAHGANIIHRDLKPDNIFLERDNFVRIIDFGVIKLLGPDAPSTERNLVQGTGQYMAPEQLLTGDVTVRGDIFSLGVVVYEMIYGQCPALAGLVNDDLRLVTQNQILRPPKPLRKLLKWVPAYASRFVQRLLAKNPDERPQDMGEVATGLRSLIERLRKEADLRVSEIRDLSVPSAPAPSAQPVTSNTSSVANRRAPSQAPTKPALALAQQLGARVTAPQRPENRSAGIHVAPTAPVQPLLATEAPSAPRVAPQPAQLGDAQLARSQRATAPVGSPTFLTGRTAHSEASEVDVESNTSAAPAQRAPAELAAAELVAPAMLAEPHSSGETPEPSVVALDVASDPAEVPAVRVPLAWAQPPSSYPRAARAGMAWGAAIGLVSGLGVLALDSRPVDRVPPEEAARAAHTLITSVGSEVVVPSKEPPARPVNTMDSNQWQPPASAAPAPPVSPRRPVKPKSAIKKTVPQPMASAAPPAPTVSKSWIVVRNDEEEFHLPASGLDKKPPGDKPSAPQRKSIFDEPLFPPVVKP